MVSYIKETLLSDEHSLYETRPHWVVFLSPVIMILAAWVVSTYASIIAVIILVFGLVAGIRAFIFYQTSEYAITDKRILIKMGWVRRFSLEIYLNRVESVQVSQSVLGRIFGYGAIQVVGMGGSPDFFPWVPNPLEFRKQAEEAVEKFMKA